MNLILYKSSDLKPLSPLEVLGEFAKNRFGKKFPVAVKTRCYNLPTILRFYGIIMWWFGKWQTELYLFANMTIKLPHKEKKLNNIRI